MNLNKMWTATALALLTVTNFANAADTKDVQMDPPLIISQAKDGGAFSVAADLLYWKAIEDGTEYVTNTPTTTTGDASGATAEIKSAEGKFKPGVRLGVRYLSQHDAFDFRFDWTHHKSTSSKTDTATFGTNRLDSMLTAPDLARQLPMTNATENQDIAGPLIFAQYDTLSAKGEYVLKSDWLDLSMGRVMNPFGTKWLSVRPHTGFRYVNMKRDLNVTINHDNVSKTANVPAGPGPYTSMNMGSLPAIDNITLKNNLNGFGVRSGIDTEWGLAKNWNIYASFAASLLWGKHNVNFIESSKRIQLTGGQLQPPLAPIPVETTGSFIVGTATGSDAEGNYYRNNHQSMSSVKGMTDMALGLMWEDCFDGNWGLTVTAGWEHHMIYGFNQSFHLATDTNTIIRHHGNLFMGGFVLGLKLDF